MTTTDTNLADQIADARAHYMSLFEQGPPDAVHEVDFWTHVAEAETTLADLHHRNGDAADSEHYQSLAEKSARDAAEWAADMATAAQDGA